MPSTLFRRKTEYRRCGFTISETLIAMCILAVLMALLVPNVATMRTKLRQVGLDAKAETIYVAAQSQLVRLRTGGNAELYANCTNVLPGDPSDAVSADDSGESVVRSLCYTYPGDTVGDAIMTGNTVDGTLLDNYWVIEFDAASGNVYAVFYSESRNIVSEYQTKWGKYDGLRDVEARLGSGAEVGYYGGDVTSSTSGTSQLKPTIDPKNDETLSVFLQCTAPKSTDELVFTLTMRDEYGHRCKRVYSTSTLPQVRQAGRSFYLELTLDDLATPETRFNALYGSESGHPADEQLVPGSRLTLVLTVSSKSGLIETSTPVSATINSLFGDDSADGTAQILCGRHLQNLDADSGVTSDVVAAMQMQDVDFIDEEPDGWFDLYHGRYYNGAQLGAPRFKPIVNAALATYDGGGQRIVGLNAGGEGSTGLFGQIGGGVSIQHLRMTHTTVRGDIAGALVGSVLGADSRIEDCRVYLDRGDLQGKSDEDIWIGGTEYAGGLVGVVGSGSLDVADSFAATVIAAEGAGGAAGGLIAYAGGTVRLETSYADCYLTADMTGGLVGAGGVSMLNCYAAGFQNGATAAGLVCGNVTRAENCYTVCALEGRDGADTYSTARTIGTSNDVYYFTAGSTPAHDLAGTVAIGGIGGAALRDRLGSAFRLDPGDTVPYNLRAQGLTTYPYPRLTVSRHYGDWQAEFQTGSLVYYERYANADRTGGFYGANVKSTLTDGGIVVGDGYGVVVYKGGDHALPPAVTVTLDGESPVALNTAAGFDVEDPENHAVYFVVPLPKEMVNDEPKTGEFYRSIKIESGGDTLSFYFNPHFANTAVAIQGDAGETPPVEEVLIRTPRQLHCMSLYYDVYYAALTRNSVFRQQRDMNYSRYDWAAYTTQESAVSAQEPIGKNGISPFRATYDGGCYVISDVSFISANGEYVGMFGYNTGTLQNVVLATDYLPDAADHFFVKRTEEMEANRPVYMGVLAGGNGAGGTINNCAVAGYYLAGSDGTLHAYENCSLYAGGLVGRNDGTIRNSEADCPAMRLASVFATVRVGGFAGVNGTSGTIDNCYALGHIEVTDSRGDGVHISGFAGRNDGKMQNCYCAVSLIASGEARVYSFAPKGGFVTNCTYLDRGVYSYVGTLRSFNNTTNSSGDAATYKQMRAARIRAAAKQDTSLFHPNTESISLDYYPFRAVVRNRQGDYVHYGDWQIAPAMGTFGVFYWEKEEHGSNNGYHFTYVGTANGNADSGTSLCNAHDDGGEITSFGYGYYVMSGQEEDLHFTSTGIAVGNTCNTAAKAALEQQIADYTFFPYTTRVANSGDYVYLNNGENATGRWTLNYRTDTITYEIAPFFANAIRRLDAGTRLTVTALDGSQTDYAAEMGGEENNFEIRSVDQLQYINWNHVDKNTDALVDGDNARQFPYLQYATNLSVGVQNKNDVRPCKFWKQSHDVSGESSGSFTPIAGMGTSSPFTTSDYSNFLYAWFGNSYDGQSYKIKNLNVVSPAYSVGLFGVTLGADVKNIIMFSDNGARVERRTAGTDYENLDGAYNLGGLVGVAYEYKASSISNKLENCAVAGYNVIDSSTNRMGAGTANVGGLVGLASMNLSRCSAVTDIKIASTHANGHMAWGSYIRVGGLVGSAGAPGATLAISDCYTGGSVTVDPTTLNEKPAIDGNGFAVRDSGGVGKSLNIFVSGMVGGSYALNMSNITGITSRQPDGTANINNCYTYLQLPSLEGNIRAVSLFANQGDRFGRGTSITLSNCYYLESIKNGIGHPDREDPTTWPAYFFVNSAKFVSGVSKAPTAAEWALLRKPESECNATQKESRDALIAKFKYFVISDEEFEAMLQGDLTCMTKYLYAQGDGENAVTTKAAYDALFTGEGGTYNSAAAPITYKTRGTAAQGVSFETLHSATMATSLGENWDWVTVREPNGAAIDGKYSFSSQNSQEGKNYPFPTVIRQKDLTFSTKTNAVYVNVHYGAWPSTGYEWEKGRDSMDLFADMDVSDLAANEEGPYAEKTFKLSYRKAENFLGEELSFDEDPEGRWELAGYTRDDAEQCFYVTVRALKPGIVVLTENLSGASFSLNITADLTLSAGEEEPVLYHGTQREVSLVARASLPAETEAALRNDFTNAPKGEWSFSADETLLELETTAEPSRLLITGHEPGRHALMATYTYDYHGTDVQVSSFISTRTLGYIGLSNGETHVSAKRTALTGFAPIESGTFGGTPRRPDGAEVFLFATAADDDLDQFKIETVTVKTEQGAAYKVYDRSGGAVDTASFVVNFFDTDGVPDVTQDETFSYRGASVRYLGTQERSPAVEIRVELTDPNGVGRYALTVPMSEAPKYAVHFAANGGTGQMHDKGIVDGTFTAPVCGFTRAGYQFSHWSRGETEVMPGDTLTDVDGSVTLTAQWTPVVYAVHFDPGAGEGTMEDVAMTYDTAATLPACTFTYGERSFAGWYAEINGIMRTFAPGAQVMNLSQGEEVTLYARWSSMMLHLIGNGEATTYMPNGGEAYPAGYMAPEKDGWTLDGWYTEASEDGTKVLNADGTVAADVAGYTSGGTINLAGEKTLYAKWTCTAYVKISALNTDMEGNYLVASGDSGTVRLMSNSDTNNNSTKFTAINAEVLSDGEGAPYILFKRTAATSGAIWNLIAPTDIKRNYAYPRYMMFNCEGLSLRDNGSAPQLRKGEANWMWEGDYNNRNLWTYNTAIPGKLKSEFASASNALGWNGSKWAVGSGLTSYLFREQEICSFG